MKLLNSQIFSSLKLFLAKNAKNTEKCLKVKISARSSQKCKKFWILIFQILSIFSKKKCKKCKKVLKSARISKKYNKY